MDKILRIGTRGSRLALVQTELVKKAVSERFPDIECETVVIRTKGDIIRDKPISELGGSGVFAGEVERALLSGEIDIAVHSAKDLPTLLANGLEVRYVLKRADPRDIILFRKGTDPMFGSPVIGTGSDVKAALAEGGVEPGVCGPRVRTVTACQGSEICPSGCIDTYSLAKELVIIE